MKKLGIGIVGCGNIAMTYLRNAALFRGLELRAKKFHYTNNEKDITTHI